MKRVKVIGAGSIGNHLTHAARQLGCSVDLCDIDPAALARTKQVIYPERYGNWDDDIGLFSMGNEPVGNYNLICIGTPPDNHLKLAEEVLKESPEAVLVEKPLCSPELAAAQSIWDKVNNCNTKVFIGYNHVVGKVATKIRELAEGRPIGLVETIDVEFRENWSGIFDAHPWLNGPADSYLGYWRRGGGAMGEHSHAINLWQNFAQSVGAGRVSEVSALADYVTDGTVDYDKLCVLNLKTETGLIGRVVQDVVTAPPRKWGRIQGSDGFLDWQFNIEPGRDKLCWAAGKGLSKELVVEKTRPDDFIAELEHIRDVLNGRFDISPISLAEGLDTMLVIAAAHESAQSGRTVKIDYQKGYSIGALR